MPKEQKNKNGNGGRKVSLMTVSGQCVNAHPPPGGDGRPATFPRLRAHVVARPGDSCPRAAGGRSTSCRGCRVGISGSVVHRMTRQIARKTRKNRKTRETRKTPSRLTLLRYPREQMRPAEVPSAAIPPSPSSLPPSPPIPFPLPLHSIPTVSFPLPLPISDAPAGRAVQVHVARQLAKRRSWGELREGRR
jgi:hypothetical protein